MPSRFNPRALARLTSTLQSHIDRGRIPGAIAVVARAGQVELFEALGRLDPDSGAAMRDDAIFRIYSMTKPVVSLAALMLMEEGALQMNQPLSLFFPEFAQPKVQAGNELVPAAREATVHDLLRHTAGLTYGFLGANPVQQLYEANNLVDRSRTNREFCRVLASLPLQDHPGTWFQYSHATDVLGAVVEAASGRTLGQFLAERIFEPLAMKETSFNVPQPKWGRVAQPFGKDPDSGQPVTMLDHRAHASWESGGGGLFGTAHDYVRFLSMMANRGSLGGERLVSRKTVQWMTADHLGALPAYNDLLIPGYGFGLGFAVRKEAGMGPQPGSPGQYFWSGIGGTSFFIDPAEDIFALLMTQAPNQRIFFRNLFRHLVYAALD
ncbi:serine hydrolase domain-containing protein [Ramlibacter sp. PS4R-6]|uniref:serine hydrolase domain-containing protein n=1 Tax=Ramlibacter sp. PS4R-6 TaxID=3133438 RepID=UPI0030A85B74